MTVWNWRLGDRERGHETRGTVTHGKDRGSQDSSHLARWETVPSQQQSSLGGGEVTKGDIPAVCSPSLSCSKLSLVSYEAWVTPRLSSTLTAGHWRDCGESALLTAGWGVNRFTATLMSFLSKLCLVTVPTLLYINAYLHIYVHTYSFSWWCNLKLLIHLSLILYCWIWIIKILKFNTDFPFYSQLYSFFVEIITWLLKDFVSCESAWFQSFRHKK